MRLIHTDDGSLWFYAPNKGAPIAFAILFALSGAIHFYQTMYDSSAPASDSNKVLS